MSALTGRVDDAAAPDRDDDEFADVAAPGFEGDAKNVSTVELWYQGVAANFDDRSLLTVFVNESKWNAAHDAEEAFYGSRYRDPSEPIPAWAPYLSYLVLYVFAYRAVLSAYLFVTTLWYVATHWRAMAQLGGGENSMFENLFVMFCFWQCVLKFGIIVAIRDAGAARTFGWMLQHLIMVALGEEETIKSRDISFKNWLPSTDFPDAVMPGASRTFRVKAASSSRLVWDVGRADPRGSERIREAWGEGGWS